MKTDQLHAAFEASGMSLDELIKRSGLDLSRPSMSRKLRGEQPLDLEHEAIAIAGALGLKLVLNGTTFSFKAA